jgi:hypothetical protein
MATPLVVAALALLALVVWFVLRLISRAVGLVLKLALLAALVTVLAVSLGPRLGVAPQNTAPQPEAAPSLPLPPAR